MKIVIIGAGVSGLTTAICVKEAYPDSQITIVADKFGENTTSTIAGALWEWQPAVCGFYESLPESITKRDNKWAMASYRKFYQLKEQLNTGIHWRRVNFYASAPTTPKFLKNKPLGDKNFGNKAIVDKAMGNKAIGDSSGLVQTLHARSLPLAVDKNLLERKKNERISL